MLRIIRKLRPHFVVPLLCLGFYTGLFLYGKVRTEPNQFNYFKQLSLSLLAGRLDITCPARTGCHDLARKDDKFYFYHPPVPALVFLPAVLLWGQNTPDSLLVAVIGALNVFLFCLVFLRVRQSFSPVAEDRKSRYHYLRSRALGEDWAYALLWGLGTVHFYISMQGDVWHLAQLVAQTFLLLAIWLIFSKRTPGVLGAGIAFGLAVYSRYDLVLGAAFFLIVLWSHVKRPRELLRKAFLFLLPFGLFSIVVALYNYARFGDILELGVSYMQLEVKSGIAARVAEVGKISLQNLGPNLYQEFLRPPEFTRSFPYIAIDPHGFGIFWATPALLMVFPLIGQWYLKYRAEPQLDTAGLVSLACLVSYGLIAGFFLLLSGHGFMQFAARYTLDFQIFPILLLALNPGFFSRNILWGLILVSIAVNLSGAVLFTDFFRLAAGVP